MTVYVDTLRIRADVPNGARVVRGRWTHLMADTVEELDAFAFRLGLIRQWRQDKSSGVHYDVTESKHRLAVRLGAVEVESGSAAWLEVVDRARTQYLLLSDPR